MGCFGNMALSVRNEEVGHTLVVHQHICALYNNVRTLTELGDKFVWYRRPEVATILFKLRNIEENKEDLVTLAKAMHTIDDGDCEIILQPDHISVIVFLFHRELRRHPSLFVCQYPSFSPFPYCIKGDGISVRVLTKPPKGRDLVDK